MIRVAIAAVEDEDVSEESVRNGVAAIRAVLFRRNHAEVDFRNVPDEQALIRAALRMWADEGRADLVLTVGGVGAGRRQRTPEATSEVIERPFPGIPETIRTAAGDDPEAPLWRCQAGARRATLIVNLPPGEAAGRALLAVITPLELAVERSRSTV